MTDAPKAKKSEMLEVRITHETKQSFLAACRDAGRTASDVVRSQIDAFIAGAAAQKAPPANVTPLQPRLRKRTIIAAGAGLAGLTLAALAPSAAAAGAHVLFDHRSDRAFQTLDVNHDGVLSPAEYAAAR